ncbi:MAG: hypothetical protein PHX62_09720 [Bacilli bacterium]|nr:hypothetical protein [Bacilli bacterium]
MELDKLLEEYKEISIKLHLEDDFIIKKKYIDKSNAIIKKVCAQKKEEEFFDSLFSSTEPWVLADAADDGFNCSYNIHKCLSILEHLKENANNLVFCSDPIKNEKARQYYSKFTDLNFYKKEVTFYDYINNDYLYRKCYEYFRLIAQHINWYYAQNNKRYKDESIEIINLLNNLKKGNCLDFVFNIANKKYQESEHSLNYLAVNSYYACKFGYERKKYRKILANILKVDAKNLTPNLIYLVNKYLDGIDNNVTPDLKTF